MPAEKTILVIESNEAMKFALSRISLGAGVHMRFMEPADSSHDLTDCSIILADDSILQGSDEKLPIVALKEQFGCPIILMTASANKRIAGYARENGAAAVLFKPFGAGDLRREIGKALGESFSRDTPTDSQTESQSASEQAVLKSADLGGRIAGDDVFDDLFVELKRRQPLDDGLDAFDVVERHLVRRALEACDGNQSHSARFLGITRNTLRKRIHKYGFANLINGDDKKRNNAEK